MKPNICRALALSAAALLSGCYESNVKVLNYGDQANLSGSYSCSSVTGLFPEQTVTIQELVVGSGEKIDYRYKVSDGGTFRLSEMDTGMMLGQTMRGARGWGRRERDARYGFVYFDIRGDSGFTIHEAKFNASSEDISEAAESRNVVPKESKYGRGPTFTLTGSADELFDFFNDHRRYMLQETVSCSRT
jgi:hypothetical protein